jgi:hypothetical protein
MLILLTPLAIKELFRIDDTYIDRSLPVLAAIFFRSIFIVGDLIAPTESPAVSSCLYPHPPSSDFSSSFQLASAWLSARPAPRSRIYTRVESKWENEWMTSSRRYLIYPLSTLFHFALDSDENGDGGGGGDWGRWDLFSASSSFLQLYSCRWVEQREGRELKRNLSTYLLIYSIFIF